MPWLPTSKLGRLGEGSVAESPGYRETEAEPGEVLRVKFSDPKNLNLRVAVSEAFARLLNEMPSELSDGVIEDICTAIRQTVANVMRAQKEKHRL
jgi:hypothetical protein